MNTISIDPATQKIEHLDIEMKANTIYSFFNSILIDELSTLKQHTIYTNANALSEMQKPFFLGEQLIIGKALIVGLNGMEEIDATITSEQLKELLDFEVNAFYSDALILLAQSDINLYRTFDVMQGDETLALNAEWVLYTFNMADERTKEYFLTELQKSLDAKEEVSSFMKKMAQLALNAAAQSQP